MRYGGKNRCFVHVRGRFRVQGDWRADSHIVHIRTLELHLIAAHVL